jgi:hypothetical protein
MHQPVAYAHVRAPHFVSAARVPKQSRALAIIDPETGKNVMESVMNEKSAVTNASKIQQYDNSGTSQKIAS